MVDVIVFEIGSLQCAVQLSAVREVVTLGPITPVPCPTPTLAGAVNLRGQVVPVLRLDPLIRAAHAMPPPRQGRTGLLVRAAGYLAILHVGRFHEVTHLGAARVLSSGAAADICTVLAVARGELTGRGDGAQALHLVHVDLALRRVARLLDPGDAAGAA